MTTITLQLSSASAAMSDCASAGLANAIWSDDPQIDHVADAARSLLESGIGRKQGD